MPHFESQTVARNARSRLNRAVMLLALAAVFSCLASPSGALERVPARATDLENSKLWRSGSTCTVAYFNICTGWVWIWTGWEPRDQVGVFANSCAPDLSTLLATGMFCQTGVPPGYGFTGTISVYEVDQNRCAVGPPLATQEYVPSSGWNTYEWGIDVPGQFLLLTEHGPGEENPLALVSDHPAAGPSGPIPCGTCFPTTRSNHSFYYGPADSSLCPGSSFFDGFCNAQLLWDLIIQAVPVSVETSSWGAIKALYR
jgi:hypothetical protein